jgi:DNA-binding LacI/PurR family transcriptional regulator
MMTGLHDSAREHRALRAFVEHRADGIALASCVSEPATVFAQMPRSRAVFVQPDHPGMADAGAPDQGALQSDDAAGVVELVRHLVDRGYRRVAYVGAGGGPSDRARRAAAADALEGLVGEPLRAYDAGLAGWRDPTRVAELIARDRPDAVMCYDDKLALALMDTLRLTPVDVPDDMAVTGFDGIAQAARSRPRLTTIAVPSVELGRRAVGMLIASMHDGAAPRSETMPVRLVIGETTPSRIEPIGADRDAVSIGAAAGGRA